MHHEMCDAGYHCPLRGSASFSLFSFVKLRSLQLYSSVDLRHLMKNNPSTYSGPNSVVLQFKSIF